MLNDEICELREKLNQSIINGEDYTITYKLSIELDELIAKYYKMEKVTKKKPSNKVHKMIMIQIVNNANSILNCILFYFGKNTIKSFFVDIVKKMLYN